MQCLLFYVVLSAIATGFDVDLLHCGRALVFFLRKNKPQSIFPATFVQFPRALNGTHCTSVLRERLTLLFRCWSQCRSTYGYQLCSALRRITPCALETCRNATIIFPRHGVVHEVIGFSCIWWMFSFALAVRGPVHIPSRILTNVWIR